MLDGLVVGAVALIAGGSPVTAFRVGLAMTALQMSIGTLNDVVDAPHDAGHKPGKPIPAGVVPRRFAWMVAITAAGLGLVVSATFGTVLLGVAVLVLAIGYAYDVVFKGTAWSWLPFAVGIPILPVFGWLGATDHLPAAFIVLLPAAVLAGAALAISNARVDAERDAAAGVSSIALRLGARSWVVHAALLAVVIVAALASLVAAPSVPVVAVLGASAAAVVIAMGVIIGRSGDVARRERAWELDAIGVGLLAAAWLAGFPLRG